MTTLRDAISVAIHENGFQGHRYNHDQAEEVLRVLTDAGIDVGAEVGIDAEEPKPSPFHALPDHASFIVIQPNPDITYTAAGLNSLREAHQVMLRDCAQRNGKPVPLVLLAVDNETIAHAQDMRAILTVNEARQLLGTTGLEGGDNGRT